MPIIYMNIGGNGVAWLGDVAITNGTGIKDASPKNAKIVVFSPITRWARTIDPKRVKKPIHTKTIISLYSLLANESILNVNASAEIVRETDTWATAKIEYGSFGFVFFPISRGMTVKNTVQKMKNKAPIASENHELSPLIYAIYAPNRIVIKLLMARKCT